MGLFKRFQKRSISTSDWIPEGTSGNFADVRVTPDQALRLSAVWACVRLLSDCVSTLPVKAHRRSGEEFPSPLLAAPAAGWTLPDWLAAIMTSLLLRGNAYGFITARAGSRLTATQVELVNPDLMSTQVDPDGRVIRRFRGQEVDPNDLWHVKAFPYPGNPDGLSPIQFGAESIGLGLSIQRFGQGYFSDGAMPSGVLKVGPNASEEMVELARAKLFNATHGRRQPLIIGGEVAWTPLSINPEESQFLDSMKFHVGQVARIFSVPPEMIGESSGDNSRTYSNIEARSLAFLQYSITPWLVRLENAIGSLLPRGSYVKFQTGGLLKSTTKERMESYTLALNAGILTLPEVRALEDLPELEGEVVQLPLRLEGGSVG